ITAPIAERLITLVGVMQTFAILGIVYFIVVVGSALFMKNPPEGYEPPGWAPSAVQVAERSGGDYVLAEALKTWQWYALWGLLFLNTSAGISIISQAAPMAQEITGVTALVAAGLVGIISIANASGRFLWAWLSDFIGRRWVFLTMFLIQAVVFFFLPNVTAFCLFSVLFFIVLPCYGGGFGTMPAFAADYFGARNVGPIYGLMLTAWGFAGLLGPTVIASVRQSTGKYTEALHITAVIMLVSSILPFLVHPPSPRSETGRGVRITSMPQPHGGRT